MTILSSVFKFLQNRNFVIVSPDWSSRNVHEKNQWYQNDFYDIMENDEVRNQAYRKVIYETVKNKIVIEVGTGKAVLLPKICVEAGAKKIYTIEENEKAFVSSKKLIQRLGLNTKIKAYQGFSVDVETEEKGDVFLHEIVGYLGSNEGMVSVTNDAKKRLLKADAQFIPYKCVTMISPVSPLKLSRKDKIANRILTLMGGEYCLDVSQPKNLYRIRNFPLDNIIVKSQVFEDIVFEKEILEKEEKEIDFLISDKNLFDGFIVYIKLFVGENTIVNSLEHKTSWAVGYIKLFEQPIELDPGNTIKVKIRSDLSTIEPKYEIYTKVFQKDNELLQSSYFTF